MVVYLSVVIAASVFATVGMPMLQSGYNTNNVETNHFSVTWMGFSPTDYSNQYPEYYICINNLAENTLTMQVALQIKNQESSGYYFLIEQYSAPPAGWTISTYYIGYIAVDETKTIVYSDLQRTRPTSISGGVQTESVDLVVKAYWDVSYTDLYSQDNFAVTFHLIDRTSAAWKQLYYNDFDDGTTQGWSGASHDSDGQYWLGVLSTYYRSFQYSLGLRDTSSALGPACYRKSFDTTGPYSEAYLVFSIRSDNWPGECQIEFDNVDYFRTDVAPSNHVWYQFAIPLPVGQTSQVEIFAHNYALSYAYLDDVYIIAK